ARDEPAGRLRRGRRARRKRQARSVGGRRGLDRDLIRASRAARVISRCTSSRRRAVMKHAFVGALLAGAVCVASATMQGQKAKPFTCDTDNGGLTLPAGFCAGVIADNLGAARNLVVAPNGDIFVSLRNGPVAQGQPPQPGYLLGLRDTDGDGRIDTQEKFGTQGATGIRLRNGYLYYATPTSIERFKMTPGELKPSGPAEVIVGDFPSGANQRGHRDKDIAFDNAGNVYVNVGLPSNACAEPDRQKGAKGVDPCPQLEEHGGIWKF